MIVIHLKMCAQLETRSHKIRIKDFFQRFFFDFYRNSILILIFIYLYIVPRNPTCVVSDINIPRGLKNLNF
jgi:hypothetical protein